MSNRDKFFIILILAVVVLTVLIGAAVVISGNNPAQTDTTDSAMTKIGQPGVKAYMLTALAGSDQNGTVVFEQLENKLRVTVELNRASKSKQPVKIYNGRCLKLAQMAYPLNDLVAGKSVTILNTTFEELRNLGDTVVNVHKSATEMAIDQACGELVF